MLGCSEDTKTATDKIRAIEASNDYTDNIRLKAIIEEMNADPTNPIPWAKRAEFYLGQGQNAAALADAKHAFSLDTTSPEAFVLMAKAMLPNGKPDSAALFVFRAKQKGYNSPGLRVVSGEILLIARRYKEALAELDAAISLSPENARAYFYKGLVFEEQGDTAKAISYFQESLTLDPELADGHNKLASLFMRQHKMDLAAAHLRSGLRFAPTDAFIYFNLGVYFEQLSENDSAISYFKKATFFEPSMYLANYKLGTYAYKERNYLEATNRLEAALQYAPSLVEARFFLALSREFMGNTDEALNQYREVIKQGKGYQKDSREGIDRILAHQKKQANQDREAEMADTSTL